MTDTDRRGRTWTPAQRAEQADKARAWHAARRAAGQPHPGARREPSINQRIDMREYGRRSAAARWTPERRAAHSAFMREWWARRNSH